VRSPCVRFTLRWLMPTIVEVDVAGLPGWHRNRLYTPDSGAARRRDISGNPYLLLSVAVVCICAYLGWARICNAIDELMASDHASRRDR
jgi:hypothetical protein